MEKADEIKLKELEGLCERIGRVAQYHPNHPYQRLVPEELILELLKLLRGETDEKPGA